MSEVPPRIKNMLYAHSGNECANPSCHAKLVYVEDNAIDSQVCHIEAKSSGGPRYNPNQTEEERNGYENLILLCHKCHEMIDNNPETYTVELLKKWKKEHEDKYKNANKEKVFRTPIPDGLLPRDKEVDKLFDGISKNRIYNLIGVGGSGKSSLAYLMIHKYKDFFNEIAFVVVNSDIKQDIVTQLNRTLKFELKKDLYPEIISHLQENFKSEQPNLIVLDINETADKDKIDNFITEILQDNLFLDGWKFLILTRENVEDRKRIAFHSLKDEDDFDFLKKLFLDRAGERYEDFGDFETLFRIIFYNPLLAEQLGIYLSNEPQTATLDDITTVLYGTTFREEDMQGMSAQRHDETIVSFLKNLIVYDKLDKNEQTLLRHFVLWQSDYISYDVIADLLKGVFETDSVLKKVLKTLTSRSLLETKVNDDKVLCYKLHGLLAFSLREQIVFEVEEDWKGYLDNIERIIEYSYYKFLPYVDCIGNSLCEFDIGAYKCSNLLFDCGVKFMKTLNYNYSHFLFGKCIFLLTVLINVIHSHPEWQFNLSDYECDLSTAYNNFASLQQHYDNKAAKESYNKSIEILEKISIDNPEYQEELVVPYRNLATLLSDKFNDFKSAKKYYEKAITIGEQCSKSDENLLSLISSYINFASFLNNKLTDYELAKEYYDKAKNTIALLPEDNSEVQYILVKLYYNVALLQRNLNNFESSKNYFNQAIEIVERLTKGNPEYQRYLAYVYNEFAKFQTENLKEYESAKSNLEKAIAIGVQWPMNNFVYQNDLVIFYSDLAMLQQEHLEDYKSAALNYEKAIEVGERLPKDNPDYQFTLAKVYYDFAKFQEEHLDGYESAKANFEKAIAIGKLLPKENSEYQHDLANAYMGLALIEEKQKKYSDAESNAFSAINIYKQLEEFLPDLCLGLNSEAFLADLYLTTGKTAQAKEILDRIQPLAKKCLADNPNEDFVILLNQGVDETVDQYSQKLNQDN